MKTQKHKKAVEVEIFSAIEQIYKQGKLLGGGSEGEVYKITKGVVAKIWSENWFGKTTIRELRKRFNEVQIHLKKYPKWVKQPEFLGYEQHFNKIITYHEYIPKSRNQKYQKQFFRKVDDGYFCDISDKNIIENKKGLYLVDVAKCRYRP